MADKSWTNKKSSGGSVSASAAKSTGGKTHENDFQKEQGQKNTSEKRQFGGLKRKE